MKAVELENVEAIETGTFIDKLSGVGGIPRGVITEIWGDESVGKSTLCLQMVAFSQRNGMKCLWVDSEQYFTPRYASEMGVNLNELEVLREDYAEALLNELVAQIEANDYDLVILDSIGGLTPKAEFEKLFGERVIGGQAGLIARFCRRVVPLLAQKKVALVVINHSFVDIATTGLKTSGGKKLSYHKSFSVRLTVNSKKTLFQGERKIGKVIEGRVYKNRVAATEGREEEAQLIFGKGFSAAANRMQELIDTGEITKDGQMYVYKGERYRGQHKMREFLEANPEA